jgi:hypothetical protein
MTQRTDFLEHLMFLFFFFVDIILSLSLFLLHFYNKENGRECIYITEKVSKFPSQ